MTREGCGYTGRGLPRAISVESRLFSLLTLLWQTDG
jgi:hypothetical protein